MADTILTPIMTDWNAPSGVATEDDYESTMRGWKALDQNTATYWDSDYGTYPRWIKYDFGEGNDVIVNKYGIITINDTQYLPEDWTLQGSNNDVNWDTLDTQTDIISGWSGTIPQTWEIENTTSYRYYKLNITDGNHEQNDVIIKEWQLLQIEETEPPATATTTGDIMALGSIVLGLGIIATMMFIGLVGYIFNRISSKKPWKY